MRIYLAARYSRAMEMCDYANQLAAMGHEITSRWIRRDLEATAEESLDDAHQDLYTQSAQEDLEDLRSADCILCFTEAPRSTNSRGGRHVEFGAALALDKRLMLVGPRENIFHHIPNVEVYETWNQLLQVLKSASPLEPSTTFNG